MNKTVYQNILIIGKRIRIFDYCPTKGTENTTVTTEDKYSANMSKSRKKLV